MAVSLFDSEDTVRNPIDLVEEIVDANQWPFERQGMSELSVTVAGAWCDYHLGFSHSDQFGGLQVACSYDVRVSGRKYAEICELLALVNERMWLGHFDLWSEEQVPMFRHALLLDATAPPSSDYLERIIEIAVTECERYYPAFQFVLWGGKTADEAIVAAMLETAGEA